MLDEPIALAQFGADPAGTSIPLLNCFVLAGFNRNEISARIQAASVDDASAHILQEKLASSVTKHIKEVWPDHPVKIKFQINSGRLSFLVEDDGVEFRVKRTTQRSDGFRQFLSFLLTASADSRANNFNNRLLLLDEPETHLHPRAQEFLRNELVKIASHGGNVVFYATHSIFMIDKSAMERNHRVSKQNNLETSVSSISTGRKSFHEVVFEAFNISSTDYHNELYGLVESEPQLKSKLEALGKKCNWNNDKTKKKESVCLPTYVRHSIHHPENTKNPAVTELQLEESINMLRNLRLNP